ncbi:hypothetical protein WJX73_003643 [Symbiochloris irregularis]|uniref:non-specific serine/threonine protein kinase n=1 Tax=Symbiochloris irregularis TaxID=706552 RepID=A0AAW1PD08_9CHLO
MGNQLSQPQRFAPENLQELPRVVFKQGLGGGRLLKTVLCIHDEAGLVVVKVYYKRSDTPDLRPYEAALEDVRRRLTGIESSHVWPFQKIAQGDRAAFLVRQHVFANLHTRLSTRPFLSEVEKLWVAFQLLHAVAQSHAAGVCHGDIKCENVVVTSWNWAFLTDFQPFKPTHLPADNPADFSFFFDTGGRRRCYIAPERFHPTGTAQAPNAPLHPAMDIFSLGCCLAELFLDGNALFDLSKLLSYRGGDFDPAPSLNKVEPEMRRMILHMIQSNPGERWSAARYLAECGPQIFPPYFESVLHPLFASMLKADPDKRVGMLSHAFANVRGAILRCTAAPVASPETAGAGSQQPGIRQPADKQADVKETGKSNAHAEGMVLVAVLLCALVRGAKLQDSRARAVAMLSQAAEMCDDDTRLQRIVPYLLALISEPGMAGVRCGALWCLGRVLSSVRSLPPSDAKIFNEYILPSLSLVSNDPEGCVRVEYASIIVPLAKTAHAFLMRLQHAASLAASSTTSGPPVARYDEETRQLQAAVRSVVTDLVAGSQATPDTKRALLPHVEDLAQFLGSRASNDFLLPTMIAFLNDRSWQLRAGFFAHIPCMASCAGLAGLEAFLLPCLEQALADPQEAVIAQALAFLKTLTVAGQLRRRSLLAAIVRVCPGLLQHPAASVRRRHKKRDRRMADPHSFHQPHSAPRQSPQGVGGPQGPAAAPRTRSKHPDVTKRRCTVFPSTPDSYPLAHPTSQQPLIPSQPPLARSQIQTSEVGPQKPGEATHPRDLVAHARRLNQPAAALASVQVNHRLAHQVHLGSEEALSFSAAASGVPSAMQAAMTTGITPAMSNNGSGGNSSGTTPYPSGGSAASSAAAWHPRGVLTAHLAEHKRGVNSLAALQGDAFVVSGSSDETVKVWDCRRLERDVSFRSRLTFSSQGGRMLAVAGCEGGQSVASASSNGSIHVWRVEYTTRAGGAPDRYTGLTGRCQVAPDEGAVLDVVEWGGLLLFATQKGALHGWDLRCKRDAWTLPCRPHEGLMHRFAVDPRGADWLVTGTRRGCMGLWDMRFRVRAASWLHPTRAPIEAMSPALAAPQALGLRQAPAAPLLYVAAGAEEVGLWDIAQGRCHQVLQVAGKQDPANPNLPEPAAFQNPVPIDPSSAAAAPSSSSQQTPRLDDNALAEHLAVQELVTPPSRVPGCRALLPIGAGAVLTGSTSGAIRLWNAARVEDSYMVCAPPPPYSPPEAPTAPTTPGSADEASQAEEETQVSDAYVYNSRAVNGVPVIEELTITRRVEVKAHAGLTAPWVCESALMHQDGVTDMLAIEGGGERTLLTCSLDGTVKAWR